MATDIWVETRICPYCHSGDVGQHQIVNSPPLFSIDFCNGKLPVQAIVRYVKCNQCGLIIQSPRMGDERLAHYYASGIYRNTLGTSVADMDRGEKLRADTVATWLEGLNIGQINSHLDIGCSRGYFLKRIKARHQYGWDFNHDYAMEQITVVRTKAELVKCELVSALHVLEHTTSPQDELNWYKSLSSRWVLIEVPRVDAGLRFPHLYYFPPEVLAGMFKKAKLNIVSMIEYPNTRILAEI